MFNRVKFILSKRIFQNKDYFLDGKKKLNNMKKDYRQFSTSCEAPSQKPPPKGSDNFLVVLLMCGIVFVAKSNWPPPENPPSTPKDFEWIVM